MRARQLAQHRHAQMLREKQEGMRRRARNEDDGGSGAFPGEVFFLVALLIGTWNIRIAGCADTLCGCAAAVAAVCFVYFQHDGDFVGPQKVDDTSFELRISLENAFTGDPVQIEFPGGRQLKCDVCHGQGGVGHGNVQTCPRCKVASACPRC